MRFQFQQMRLMLPVSVPRRSSRFSGRISICIRLPRTMSERSLLTTVQLSRSRATV